MRYIASLIITCIVLLIGSHSGCNDPNEYEPPEDTLSPPPDPPQLAAPIDHYVFMDPSALPGFSFFIPVTLAWTTVEGAEVYVLELTTADLPPNLMTLENNSWNFMIHDDITKLCDYQWRVRAGSTQWDGMTDWSEQWYFEARLRPSGPTLVSPANYSTIVADTLPALIELIWNAVCDEQFYSVKICKDAQIIDSITVYTCLFECFAEEPGTYSWQVWAGSPFWQYPSFPSDTNYFTVVTR